MCVGDDLRSIALTQVRQQRALEEASQWAGTKVVHPDAIPGMLLHIGLLNLFSDLPVRLYEPEALYQCVCSAAMCFVWAHLDSKGGCCVCQIY